RGPSRGARSGPRSGRRALRSGRARTATGRRARYINCSAMTYIIAEPCMLIIDPEECIDCGACEPECPVEAIFPEDALPEKWEPFVKINYAYGEGADVINKLVDKYATEHNVQNPPLDQR